MMTFKKDSFALIDETGSVDDKSVEDEPSYDDDVNYIGIEMTYQPTSQPEVISWPTEGEREDWLEQRLVGQRLIAIAMDFCISGMKLWDVLPEPKPLTWKDFMHNYLSTAPIDSNCQHVAHRILSEDFNEYYE